MHTEHTRRGDSSPPPSKYLTFSGDLQEYLHNLPSVTKRLSSTGAGSGNWYRYTYIDRLRGSFDDFFQVALSVFLVTLIFPILRPHPVTIGFSLMMFLLVVVAHRGALRRHSVPSGLIRSIERDLDGLLDGIVGTDGTRFTVHRNVVSHGPEKEDALVLAEGSGSWIYLLGDGNGTWVHVGPLKDAGTLARVVDGAALQ